MTIKKKTISSQVDLAKLAHLHDEAGAVIQQFDMRIDVRGRWFHQGDEIKRKPLVRLFASILTRLDDGTYWLITPAERGMITVEDAPFFAPLIEWSGDGKMDEGGSIDIITNLDDRITLGADHKIRVAYNKDGQPRPYVNIRGGLDALLSRSVYYQLAEQATRGDDGRFGVYSSGAFIALD